VALSGAPMEAAFHPREEVDATRAGASPCPEVSHEWTRPPGGMLVPRTCTPPFLTLTLIVVVFCHCWHNVDASSLLYEPPYTEPYGGVGGRRRQLRLLPYLRFKQSAFDSNRAPTKFETERQRNSKQSANEIRNRAPTKFETQRQGREI
jgi:hypothetical protein